MPEILHRCRLCLKLRVCPLIDVVDCPENRTVIRVKIQPAERHIGTVIKGKSGRALHSDQSSIDAVRMLAPLEIEGRNIVIQVAVVITIAQSKAAVRLMEDRHPPEQRHRQRLSLCTEGGQ